MWLRNSASSGAVGVFVAFALTVAIAGCGDPRGPTGTVSGQVTFEGQPVTEGMVSYVSDEGHGASGQLDSAGNYTLVTVDGPGVPVGNYKVAIRPPLAEEPDELPIDYVPPDEEEYPNIPSKYRSPSTSGFTAAVKEGDNSFDFDMKAE